MFKIVLFVTFISFTIFFSNEIEGSMLLDEKIYKSIQSDFTCFRRFNETNQFGCQSAKGGNVGTVHLVKSASDIEYIIKDGPNDPYIPCLRTKHFTIENIIKLKNSNRISGLVLFDAQSDLDFPDSFTEDRRCPNEMSSYYVNDPTYGHCKTEEWNQRATALSMHELDLDFPMVLIRDQTNITNIEKCFEQFNSKVSKNYEPKKSKNLLCSLQLETWMLGAKNSKVCESRSANSFISDSSKICDPIRSYNVFSTLFSYAEDQQIEDRSVVLLTSKVDALSIFENSASGAQTTLTSLITLFSIIDLLRDQREKGVFKKNSPNILYSFFDGESYDYIGSGKTAYDLGTSGLIPLSYNKKTLNLTFFKQHLHSAIEINQATSKDKFFLHVDPLTYQDSNKRPKIENLVRSLVSPSIKLVNQSGIPLPPSSVQQLLAHDHDLPVVVISNHETDFINRYYNSFLDNERTIGDKKTIISKIAELSESIARSLVRILLEDDQKVVDLKSDLDLIEKMYDCFIIDSKCNFFNEIRGKETKLLPQFKTYPLYTSITINELSQAHYEYLMTITRLSTYLNRKKVDNVTNQEQCSEINNLKTRISYEWFNITDQKTNVSDEMCVESTKFFTYAISPVFYDDEPNWSLNYSTWTESMWNAPRVRLFVSASTFQEYITFFTGLFIFIISFFLTKWISKNADHLFIDLISERSAPVQI